MALIQSNEKVNSQNQQEFLWFIAYSANRYLFKNQSNYFFLSIVASQMCYINLVLYHFLRGIRISLCVSNFA